MNAKTFAAAVLSTAVVFYVGCSSVTGPGEYGTAELIYELSADVVPRPRLDDVSSDAETYLIRGYDEDTKERQLWTVNPPDGEPQLIIADQNLWLGAPLLSPDKEKIVFSEHDGIYVLLVSGGEPRRVYSNAVRAESFHWIDNETVLISAMEDAVYAKTVNINTLESTTLLKLTDGSNIMSVYLSPGGTLLACSIEPPWEPGFGGSASVINDFNMLGIYNANCGNRRKNDVGNLVIYSIGYRNDGAGVYQKRDVSRYAELREDEGAPVVIKVFDLLYKYWSRTAGYIFRIYEPYTGAYKELDGGPICRGWSPDGSKILFTGADVNYYDFENEELVSVFHSNKLVFESYFRFWGPGGDSIIAFATSDDGDLRVYAVSIE